MPLRIATMELVATNFCVFFAARLENSRDIQVWVQAVKFEQNWTFHDGSLVPNVFPISMTNTTGEIHLRAIGT